MAERKYGVWLKEKRVGTLNQRDDYTWFNLSSEYRDDPQREILGLIFEDDLDARHASALRLPPWFSNLLPEGRLRDWIATDRGVSPDREMEVLAQVGGDLPGAVRVIDENSGPAEPTPLIGEAKIYDPSTDDFSWKFSLAGVGLKFSMLRQGDRLSLPAFGEGGDWIVKLPDPLYSDVPLNEAAMMSLAQMCGISVPEHKLVDRQELDGLPNSAWISRETKAYAVRRFDRGPRRELIHIEDFAQVRNILPYGNGKYQGNFETIGAIIFRRRDVSELHEFVRRMVFNALVSNGDAHLKNWSLRYTDPRSPKLSPVYDVVSTAFYAENPSRDDFGLKFNGSRRYENVTLAGFTRLETKLGASGTHLAEIVVDTVAAAKENWPNVAEGLSANKELLNSIDRSLEARCRSILGRA